MKERKHDNTSNVLLFFRPYLSFLKLEKKMKTKKLKLLFDLSYYSSGFLKLCIFLSFNKFLLCETHSKLLQIVKKYYLNINSRWKSQCLL